MRKRTVAMLVVLVSGSALMLSAQGRRGSPIRAQDLEFQRELAEFRLEHAK